MSSTKFDTLIAEFPEEQAAVRHLVELVQEASSSGAREEYTPARLYDILHPSNYRVLVQMLTSAADKGLLHKSLRVYSTSGGGIQDFDSLLDIPLEIYDNRTGRFVEVSQDQIRMIFSIEN
jgi:hypothetical protein